MQAILGYCELCSDKNRYLNPNTGLDVISSPSGQFIRGWKLNSTQLQNVIKHGGL